MSNLPYDDLSSYHFCIRIAVTGTTPKCGKSSILSSFCYSKSIADNPELSSLSSNAVYLSYQPHQLDIPNATTNLHRFEYYELPNPNASPSPNPNSKILSHLFSSLSGIVFVVDLTNHHCLESLADLIKTYVQHPYQRYVVLCSKSDSKDKAVTKDDVIMACDDVASGSRVLVEEVSVFENSNVFDSLIALQSQILDDLRRSDLGKTDLYFRGIKIGPEQWKIEEILEGVVEL
ncbi:hypothetical protein P9112_006443 [Eukaryota sp. TZLM1-RC]